VTITIDGEMLDPVPGQTVISHGADRNLSVDEIGGIQLVEDAAPQRHEHEIELTDPRRMRKLNGDGPAGMVASSAPTEAHSSAAHSHATT
jgi:hypothetical protein